VELVGLAIAITILVLSLPPIARRHRHRRLERHRVRLLVAAVRNMDAETSGRPRQDGVLAAEA
jgi:hypothetical protein